MCRVGLIFGSNGRRQRYAKNLIGLANFRPITLASFHNSRVLRHKPVVAMGPDADFNAALHESVVDPMRTSTDTKAGFDQAAHRF
jgi:hypothetical protein